MEEIQMNLETRIEEVRARLSRTERTLEGKIIASRLYDETIADLEALLSQNTIRRAELSIRLGVTLLELTNLEEDIFQIRLRQVDQRRKAQEIEPEVLESVQFQAVSIQPERGGTLPIPAAPSEFTDSRTWIRIISMTGFKIELNSLSQALEVLKIVLQAHRKEFKP
jgi:hypothetical protein